MFYDEDSDESVDPIDGEKRVKVHHVVELDGELISTVDEFDPDDPKLRHYMEGDKDKRVSQNESVNGEKQVKVHHIVELDGELISETLDQFDPDDPKLKHYMKSGTDKEEGITEGITEHRSAKRRKTAKPT